MELLNSLNIDSFYATILLVNLAVAILLLAGAKTIFGIIARVNTTNELAEKDNYAFGISVAGVAMAITIMMTGVMSGEAGDSLQNEVFLVTGYGIIGIVLMAVTRIIFDKVSMPNFSVKTQIENGNIAAAVLDAGNVVATALIIRAVMMWVDSSSISGIIFVLVGYIISQAILTLASFYRLKAFNSYHNSSLQDKIIEGNVATAWRFSGYRIGVALAITATAGLIPYSTDNLPQLAIFWVITSLIMMFLVSLLVAITDKVILSGIDVRDEVDNQKNIGVAAIQFVVTISVGIIIAVLTN